MTTERRSALADLLERETAGMSALPWSRITIGHRDVFQIASAVLASLTAGEFTNTDATWVDVPNGEHAAFIGNGPKQTANARAIVALANHLPDILRELRDAAARVAALEEAAGEIVDLLLTSGRQPPPLNDYGLLSTLGFYAGPNARTAVDSRTADRVTALSRAASALRALLPPAHEGTE